MKQYNVVSLFNGMETKFEQTIYLFKKFNWNEQKESMIRFKNRAKTIKEVAKQLFNVVLATVSHRFNVVLK